MKKHIVFLFILCLISCSSHNDEEEGIVKSTSFDVLDIKVTNLEDKSPAKGEEINIKITIKNTGNSKGTAVITPKLSSSRFGDYKNVTLYNLEKTLEGGETGTATLKMNPFFQDQINEKHYALGRGEYFFESIVINNEESDNEYSGRVFNIESSTALLVPVIYDAEYLQKINNNSRMADYLAHAFTRRVELYENGDYKEYPGGFDEMMNVKHLFYPVMAQNVSEYDLDDGMCEKAIALGGNTLGLKEDWAGPVGTQTSNHGFDYLMAITPDSFGGVACSWINVQISGLFDFDLSTDRAQIVLIHETSHLFGSPHCDPLQSYVMCSGEKHRKYIDQGIYVYHIDSKNQMSNRWD